MYASISLTCTLTQTHHTQCTYTTYLRSDTCVHIPKFIYTRLSGCTYSLVCMHVCTCVCVCRKCASMCTCVYIFISHMYTLTQTRIHTMHVYNMHGKRHMCTCAMIHTNTHMSGRSCSLVCMDVCICVYVYHTVYVCMRVCICITHLYIDTDAPYTIHVHNIRAKKHVYIYHNSYTHAHERSLM